MWADFSGKAYTREQFAARIAELQWTTWRPIGITLHNTAAPTLAQWAESGPKHEARIRNLQNYYETMGWKGGPHWFISRNWLNEFSNPLRRGTHSPSFNATHFGIEMVGDYSYEPFDSGDGSLVRDNSVFAMAVLCRKFGFDPDHDIVLHKEDARTNHDCPGKLVRKDDVIVRVKAMIETLAAPGIAANPPNAPIVPAGRHSKILMTEFGDESETQEASYGGMIDPNTLGISLPFKFLGERQRVRVHRGDKSVLCDIVDVGPHNIDDNYWDKGTRPFAEEQHRDGIKDFKGRAVTNPAGIDGTPQVFDALAIPGARGMRSALIDWEFTDEITPVRNWKEPDHPAFKDDGAPPLPVAVPPPLHGKAGVEIEVVQRRLMAFGYHEVGDVDGVWGGKTAAGIAAFKNDRKLPGAAVIDAALNAELARAEADGFKRPIASARTEATEAAVEKKAPEITPIKQSRGAALWAGITTAFFAMMSAIGDSFRDVLTWLTQFKGYLNAVPGWVWLGIIAGGLAYFYIKSKKGAEGIVNSVKTGERN